MDAGDNPIRRASVASRDKRPDFVEVGKRLLAKDDFHVALTPYLAKKSLTFSGSA